ncbi:pyridoxal-phosphate dependent enzyme, partial [Pseudomonadota bacterium]
YTLIPPFDAADIISGQGTVAMELIEEAKEIDALLTPVGGGGLLSGCAIAAKHLLPSCRVIGIEPELADDAKRSFYSGTLQSVHNPDTIADGTRVSSLGQLTFPLIRQHVDDMHTVSEQAIMEAVRFAFYHLKLVIEPSGALGIAALFEGSLKVSGRVAIVISGGNIDAKTMTRILNNSQ